LSIIGVGEDGVEGLNAAARACVSQADYVFGGKRHLALVASLINGEAMPWPNPMSEALPQILNLRGTPVAVLASGDPFHHGVGSLLARDVPEVERIDLPAPSSFSLAAARIGWALQDVDMHSLCGRPLETLIPCLQPRRRLLVLSADENTPRAVAGLLSARGFGSSSITVLEALGGASECIRHCEADGFDFDDIARLNLLAIDLVAAPDAEILPLAPGLDDIRFETDGMLTKRDIRAVTLSALEPNSGGLLWDIGTGSGSIAIEWMLAHPASHAIALDSRSDRAGNAKQNAVALGVPGLKVIVGAAPDALANLAAPDAIFIGGGATAPGVIAAAWQALIPGGRLVANSVTVETDQALMSAAEEYGGSLTRISVEKLDNLGSLHAFRPAMTVTQWRVKKT
jgi:precorrin-6Y C5,15-methyltransferase (decarboxylating)